MNIHHILRIALTAAVPTLAVASCVTTTAGTSGGSSTSCPEFQVGSAVDANVQVDARVRAFMDASAQLGGVSEKVKAAVKTACAGVAVDLGAPDTWTALGDVDDAITNSKGTGACDAAQAHVTTILKANANANFALVVERGACSSSFDDEAKCEAGCSAQTKCDPGTIETRCDPAQLSVVCQSNCAAQAFCEGTESVQANCEGSCEAECSGHCAGSCVDESGKRTENDDHCHGKCSGHCSGTCSGRCQIDASAGVSCGADVHCKGGCTGSYTSPRCETEFTPPKCTLDESCFERCRADVTAKVTCDPPTVKLLADVTVSADVAKLTATIDKNLPALVEAGEAQARIAADISQRVLSSGNAVLQAGGSLDLKSAACATAAAKSLTTTAASLDVSVQAGAKTTTDCSSQAM